MTANVFDVNYYRQANPDLAAAGLTTDQQLTEHFFSSGVFEPTRQFSRIADLNLYRASNPDLAQDPNIGGNNLALYNHLAQSGVLEGRTFSAFYSPQVYRGANLDLNTLGLNNEELFNHLQATGLNEYRRFSTFFDPQFYRNVNSDLAGFSGAAIFDQFRSSGIDEIRRFSPFIDLDYYLSRNPDLAGNSRRGLFEHLQNSGVAEGRKFSPFVDVDFYLSFVASYKDLAATATAVNNNRVLAFQELQSSGLRQGQRFSPIVDLNFYRDYYPDLATLNNVDLFSQLVLTGSQQGRRLSASYDPVYYVTANPDLAALNSQQLLEHFLNSGINEPRQSSDLFNIPFYLAANPDLGANGITTGQQALNHYEAVGLREGRLANSVAISAGTAGTFLGNATNLGAFANGRSGQINDRVDNNSPSDFYRFTVTSPFNVSLQITNLTAQVSYLLVYDANGNGQGDAGEFINNGQTGSTTNIGGTLAEGTYFLVIGQVAANQQTNYRLNLSNSSISNLVNANKTSRDPGETAETALDLGILTTSPQIIELNEFIGTSDSADIYRFTSLTETNFIGQVFNISNSVTAEIILDNNSNGLLGEPGEIIFTGTGDPQKNITLVSVPEDARTFYIRITANPATAPSTNRGTYSLGYR